MVRELTRRQVLGAAGALVATTAASCGRGDTGAGRGGQTLRVSAIPDQDPTKLRELYTTLAAYLSQRLDVDVAYRPVADYATSVRAFQSGELDLVWFGGFTGVQAQQRVPSAIPLAQRDIDRDFHSVFVVNTAVRLSRIDDVAGLAALDGMRFTFGSESSTSGRLMPEYFLSEAGIDSKRDFKGGPGFSGSHDTTLAVVASGSYDAGVLNEQVWQDRARSQAPPTRRVRPVFTTPGFPDYHWLAQDGLDRRFGDGFTRRTAETFLSMTVNDSASAPILQAFGAQRFIRTNKATYAPVRRAAKDLGLL